MKSLRDMVAKLVKDPEPFPDIAICSSCGWRGSVDECETGTEGDWESGYYDIYLCPKCPDGGCIDDYDMTDARAAEFDTWWARNHETKTGKN